MQAVLVGHAVRRGDTLFLSAELVRTSDSTHIWGDEYSRKVSDILSLQSELARTVSEKLRIKLSPEQQRRVTKQGTQNPEAYALYVRGRDSANRLTVESLKESVTFFQQAVDKDPSFAAAYASMTESYLLLVGFRYVTTEEAFPKAIAAAKRGSVMNAAPAVAARALSET